MTFISNVRPRRFGAGAPKGATMTFCPDCGTDIPSDLFVAHREMEHPPKPITIAIEGIESQAAVGWDPPARKD